MNTSEPKSFSLNNLSTAERRLVIAAVASVISFFLPWIVMRGFFNSTNLGFMLMKPFFSRASGLPLGLVFLTPLSALGVLVVYLPKLRGLFKDGEKPPVYQVIIQYLLIVAGFAPFLIIPVEIKTWSGGEVNTSIGLWLAAAAQFCMLIFAIQGSLEK
ncbi:MAG: hypothetical protein JXA13_02830 [Anaerolineales bacterium]|nr:hypothetical protein [Anaerolineales bacterium]